MELLLLAGVPNAADVDPENEVVAAGYTTAKQRTNKYSMLVVDAATAQGLAINMLKCDWLAKVLGGPSKENDGFNEHVLWTAQFSKAGESISHSYLRMFHYQPDRLKKWILVRQIVRNIFSNFPKYDIGLLPNGLKEGNKMQMLSHFCTRNDVSVPDENFKPRPIPKHTERSATCSYDAEQMVSRLGSVKGFSFAHIEKWQYVSADTLNPKPTIRKHHTPKPARADSLEKVQWVDWGKNCSLSVGKKKQSERNETE